MANAKIISYVDTIARDVRAENLADVKAALEVIEDDHNLTTETIGQLRHRIQQIEANAELEHRRMSYRIECLERKGELEGGKGMDK